MFAEGNSINNSLLKNLSTAELIEAYETAKLLELSDEFQKMLRIAIKLREAEK
jgi:hypothetical protein